VLGLSAENTAPSRVVSFSGQRFDSESGMMYFKNRYYSQDQGRFISRDPVRSDLNLYSYTSNSPTRNSDPLGLTCSSTDPCCPQDIDVVITGKFQGGKTMENYMPDLKGTDSIFKPTDQAGGNSNDGKVGGQVQIVTKVTGEWNKCYFTQWVTYTKELSRGKVTPDQGKKIDDIKQSGRENDPNFVQKVNNSPSMADPFGYTNWKGKVIDAKWDYETCIYAEAGMSETCKYTRCCITWSSGDFGVAADGTPKPATITKGKAKCE
jgi:RHS repeat-associated protein